MSDAGAGRACRVVVSPDPFEAAAGLVADAIERVAGARGRVRLAVPGGSAARVASHAAERLDTRGFDFERLLLTWVDERCVPSSSPDSNRGATHLTPHPGIELPLYLHGERPDEAVARVAHALQTTFQSALDVLVLGMGPDGHVASLFPGRPALPGLVAHVANSPKPPADRITLTRALLETAVHTIVVAAGEDKRAALRRIVHGDPDLPATGLAGLVVCTDLTLE